jgi:two-component system phosphate regulon sensor histidine kinase PhoR
MKRLSGAYRRLILLGIGRYPAGTDRRTLVRLRVLNAFLICGLVIISAYALFRDIWLHDFGVAASDVATLAAFLGIITLSRRTRYAKVSFNLGLGVLAASIITAYYSETALTDIFWIGTIPIVAYLLLGQLGGAIWTGAFILSTAVVMYLDRAGILKLHLTDPVVLVYATIAMTGFALVLYYYEGINRENERLIADREDQLRVNLEVNQELSAQLALEKASIERKVAERTQELGEAQARLEASINSLENGFLLTFYDGQAISYNPALAKLFDLDSADQSGSKVSPANLIPVLQSKLGTEFDIQAAIAACHTSGQPFRSGEISVGGKFLSIFGAPIIPKGQKKAIGSVILVTDTTEARLLERSKDEFVSIASHELRTPLTAIRGNASMLLDMYTDKLPDQDMKQMLADIKDATVRLIGIVNSFLTVSRLEQQKTVFAHTKLDIGKSIEAAVNSLESLAKDKGLQLRVKLPKSLPAVQADADRTEEVIINLVGNAIKYTTKGYIEMSAEVGKGEVKVRVRDTGVGIEKDNYKLLFHKFQQASSSILTRDDSRSTGLGLYITKLLVEQMGGSIALEESVVGKGSVFSFTLPLA